MKIDFHGHNPSTSKADLFILNHTHPENDLPKDYTGPFTAGFHPWYLPESFEKSKESLTRWLTKENCLGLGECGLDRVSAKGDARLWQKQIDFFTHQLELAHEYGMNFIVIHCVRSFPECTSLIKKSSFKGKVVFHDYMAGFDQTTSLLKEERFFFSLGSALEGKGKFVAEFPKLQNPSPLIKRLFLETDDSEVPILDRYTHLSTLLNIPLSQIEEEITKNFALLNQA